MAHALRRIAVLAASTAVLACSPQDNGNAPAQARAPFQADIEVEGALIAADADVEPAAAKNFGFDILGAGLLPVRLAIENRSGGTVRVLPAQTFLVDSQGLAWPLLTADQGQGRLASTAGAQARPQRAAVDESRSEFAIGLLVESPSDENAGSEAGSKMPATEPDIRQDLIDKTLRNPPLAPGARVSGYLLFPGRDEARGAEMLRLSLEVNGHGRIVQIPLTGETTPQRRAMAR